MTGTPPRRTAGPDVGEFALLEPPSATRAAFSFTGDFEGGAVIWHCELVALGTESTLPCYIEIGPEPGPELPIRVGLTIRAVDRGNILKTITMIRNYKRLSRGRHTFGAPLGDSARGSVS